jgi:hypothetical protein
VLGLEAYRLFDSMLGLRILRWLPLCCLFSEVEVWGSVKVFDVLCLGA